MFVLLHFYEVGSAAVGRAVRNDVENLPVECSGHVWTVLDIKCDALLFSISFPCAGERIAC